MNERPAIPALSIFVDELRLILNDPSVSDGSLLGDLEMDSLSIMELIASCDGYGYALEPESLVRCVTVADLYRLVVGS